MLAAVRMITDNNPEVNSEALDQMIEDAHDLLVELKAAENRLI